MVGAAVHCMKGQWDAAVVFTVTNRQAGYQMCCTAVAGESSKSDISCRVVLFRRGVGVAFCALQLVVNTEACSRAMLSHSCGCGYGGWALEAVWTFGGEKNLSALLLSCRHDRAKGQTASSFTLSILPLAVIQSLDPIHLVVLPALLYIYMHK